LNPERFAMDYEATSTPVIVRGVPESEGWAASEWSYDRFLLDPALCSLRMKCGEDDDGGTIRVSLKDFATYVSRNCMNDDSPLYVFDSGFSDREGCKPILDGFCVPCFCGRDDLFELVGEKNRPPYRWLLLGPRRSGTCLHVDPLGTSAWNAVVTGRKRWVLFEPGTSKTIAKGTRLYNATLEDDEPINYFVDILPRIRQAYPTARRIECVQVPGETIFVPGGWWHAVLNLDDSIGVTQNFVSCTNFDTVWDKTRTGRRAVARKWFRALRSSSNGEVRALHARATSRPPV